MKKIVIILIMLISVTLFGLGKRMIGYSIENFNGYQNNLDWCHQQVDRMAVIWEDEGGTSTEYRNTTCWASDLVDSSYTGSTENYTDGNSEMVVISSHGGVSGTSSTNLWADPWMYEHNGYGGNSGSDIGNKMYFERNTEYLVLFTCFSVHDFSKDNSEISSVLQNGTTYQQWKQTIIKDSTPGIISSVDPQTNLLKMVFGFAGFSTDSAETDENGEDFLQDMYDESAKQAWFTGNEDSGTWPYDPDIDDRSGVITWGSMNGIYNPVSQYDATQIRDDIMLDTVDQPHNDYIVLSWQHHNG